jgi:hypothetical protein
MGHAAANACHAVGCSHANSGLQRSSKSAIFLWTSLQKKGLGIAQRLPPSDYWARMSSGLRLLLAFVAISVADTFYDPWRSSAPLSESYSSARREHSGIQAAPCAFSCVRPATFSQSKLYCHRSQVCHGPAWKQLPSSLSPSGESQRHLRRGNAVLELAMNALRSKYHDVDIVSGHFPCCICM